MNEKIYDKCNDDLFETMHRQANKLMYLLHELKHMDCTIEELHSKFSELFPFWTDVEWYNPKYNAVNYLFGVVLEEKNTEELK